jgi:hypothetical protein
MPFQSDPSLICVQRVIRDGIETRLARHAQVDVEDSVVETVPMFAKQQSYLWVFLVLVFGALVSSGCREGGAEKEEQEEKAKPLEFTQEKSSEEERDARALCKAGQKLATINRVRNRLKYILDAFIENGGSSDFADRFKVMGGADRHNFVEELFKKYGINETCKDGIDAFERVVDPRRKVKPKS